MSNKVIRKYGWIRDLPDHRDIVYSKLGFPPPVFPPVFDLRPMLPPVYDQGDLGSCSCNATAAAFAYDAKKQGEPDLEGSRLFLYYNVRVIEGSVNQDSGAQLRDVMNSAVSTGICQETTWPYDIAQFTAQPPPQAYTEAKAHEATQYQRVVLSLNAIKMALTTEGPVVFGISVYDSFESDAVAQTGIVPLPAPTESCLGGHALCLAGYDDSTQCFLVRNSWGSSWGIGGYCWIPYTYILNPDLCDSCWVIVRIE